MKLYHLSIASDDVLKTQNFYCKYFGFSKGFEDGPDGFIINDDGFVIVIVETAEKSSLPEWFHFGFQLDTATQVKTLYEQMKADNVILIQEVEEQKNVAGKINTLFFCLDPNGLKIEIRAIS